MKVVVLLITMTTVFGACHTKSSDKYEQLKDEILTLEKKILETEDAGKNKQTVLLLIEKTKLFAKDYPQDTLAPELLFKAGDMARGAREFGKAIHLWGLVWRNYGDHPKAPMALFLQGFTFDSDLRDSKVASKYYNDFLQKYPNDPLAEQVKQLLDVVDVKPEDLVRQFETQ